jgi:FkbM family methyltransferase
MTILISEFVDYCKEHCCEPSVIFEIGAMDAADATLLKKNFPTADVYAFEAYGAEFRKHAESEHLKGINYINLGLWNKDTRITLHQKALGSGISSIRNRGDEYEGDTVQIEVSRIDTFCEENNIPSIDIVKLDVEGCSYEVLEGFGELLKTVKIIHIETEQKEHFEGQVLEREVFILLESAGMEMLKHSHCCLTQYDSIWLRKD